MAGTLDRAGLPTSEVKGIAAEGRAETVRSQVRAGEREPSDARAQTVGAIRIAGCVLVH